MKLQNNDLLRQMGLINGQWQAADSAASFSVHNPFDHAKIATLPEMGQAETTRAIAAAQAAFPQWRDTSPAEKAGILTRWSNLVTEHLDDLATILTTEQGKPLSQAKKELEYTAENIAFYAGEALRIHGQTLQPIAPDKRTIVIRQPLGVVAGISPWNFPAMCTTSKMAGPIAAGNCVVIKPAQDTPLTPLALAYLGTQAGLPDGVLNMVVADHPEAIGDTLTQHPDVRLLTFTGSTAVGKKLYQQCASTVKNVSLEMGGNCPFIVFADADIDAAVQEAVSLKFSNCGQVCINANRFLIAEGIFDTFVDQFIAATQKLTLGSGLAAKTTVGPLINQKAVDKIETLVADAVAKGAKIATGGQRSNVGALHYQPTVLTNMQTDMRMYHEEIFGPVAPLYTFKDEQQAIAMANDTEYGLAAYFYTQDLGRAWRVSSALESGTVCINSAASFGGGPFGGYKQSGIGREKGRVDSLNAYCEVKTIAIDIAEKQSS